MGEQRDVLWGQWFVNLVSMEQCMAMGTVSIDADQPDIALFSFQVGTWRYGRYCIEFKLSRGTSGGREEWTLNQQHYFTDADKTALTPQLKKALERVVIWFDDPVSANSFSGRWEMSDGARGHVTFTSLINPVSNYPRVACNDWQHYKQNIEQMPRPVYYYRGQESSTFRLETTFARARRTNMMRYHEHIRDVAKSFNERYDTSRNIDVGAHDLLWFIHLARHHEFPTPALDWSKNAYVAAYFAFSPESSVLPNGSTKSFVRVYQVIPPEEELGLNELSNHFYHHVPVEAFRSVPDDLNERSLAQEGILSVMNFQYLDVDLVAVNRMYRYRPTIDIVAFDIPFSEREVALTDLKTMGICKERLMPDDSAAFPGISRFFAEWKSRLF